MDDQDEKARLELQLNNGIMNGYDAGGTPLHVERPVYQIEELNRDTLYEKPHLPLKSKVKAAVASVKPLQCLLHTVPLLKWLPSYSCRDHIFGDIISGITVAIMHIPQGMAYGLLGGVPPVVGIYMAFFPVLVYFVFGTSRHVSIGTFAIVCLMTGKVVSDHTSVEILQNGTRMAVEPEFRSLHNTGHYTNIEIASTVTFTVALMQLIMYGLRLGVVSTLLSDTLVGAFTCASAFHVVSSQLKDLFGLPTKKRRGNFALLYTIYDSILALPSANRTSCAISFAACIIIYLNNEFLKPWLSKKTKLPFPIELVAVLVGTTVSYCADLSGKYGLSVVGHIPTGLPYPAPPVFQLMPDILVDSFVITMVSYTITMSMALIFARKCMYEVDSNQELFALGMSNTAGSFFSCMPVTASLSRSMIQYSVGGVTQIASVISAGILLVILLWIGPLFETLPRCVLASIIVIALKGMLMQCKGIKRCWELSKWDALVWIVTFSVTLLVQISVGLAAGVATSCLSIFIQGHKPYTCLLGVVPNTDLYLDVKRYKGAREVLGIKIFHYAGGLSFAARTTFKELLHRKVGFDPQAVLRKRAKMAVKDSAEDGEELMAKCVILDFSGLTFVDPSGVDFLRQLQADYNQLDVLMYIAGCSGPVYEVMQKCDKAEKKESKFLMFPTVHDAVLYCQANVLNTKTL